MKCVECGKKISYMDKVCPHCGYPNKKLKICVNKKMLFAVVAVILIIILAFSTHFLQENNIDKYMDYLGEPISEIEKITKESLDSEGDKIFHISLDNISAGGIEGTIDFSSFNLIIPSESDSEPIVNLISWETDSGQYSKKDAEKVLNQFTKMFGAISTEKQTINEKNNNPQMYYGWLRDDMRAYLIFETQDDFESYSKINAAAMLL